MISACMLTIASLIVGFDDPDPAGWVRKLGSDRFSERVEAIKALESLGKTAIPALNAARNSDNPRIRSRVQELLARIDRGADVDRLTRPTLIKLDFHDRPLSEVLDKLNARHDLGLAVHFGPLLNRGMMFGHDPGKKAREDQFLSRRVTLEAADPLPFWTAIDRLCQVGPFQHDLRPRVNFGMSQGKFLLVSGLGGTSLVSDSGPFRVKLTGLHSSFETNLVEINPSVTAGHPRGDRDLGVKMVAIPEPGLVIRINGGLKLDEAIDDRGRNLLPPDSPKPESEATQAASSMRPDLNGTTNIECFAALRLADQASRSIRRLKGSIPAVVVGHASESMVIPIEGGAGKSVRNDEVTMTLLAVTRDDHGRVTVEVEVVPHRAAVRQPDPWDQKAPLDFVTYRDGDLDHRIELVDAEGKKLALDRWQGSGRDFRTMNQRVRLAPTILYEDQPPDLAGNVQPRKPIFLAPVALRYHGFTQTFIEIPFDFRDIPLP